MGCQTAIFVAAVPAAETPAHAARLFRTLKIWPEIGRKYRPIYPVLTNVPVANYFRINLRQPFALHGMEEVVGSIPTRSTNSKYLAFTAVAESQYMSSGRLGNCDW